MRMRGVLGHNCSGRGGEMMVNYILHVVDGRIGGGFVIGGGSE